MSIPSSCLPTKKGQLSDLLHNGLVSTLHTCLAEGVERSSAPVISSDCCAYPTPGCARVHVCTSKRKQLQQVRGVDHRVSPPLPFLLLPCAIEECQNLLNAPIEREMNAEILKRCILCLKLIPGHSTVAESVQNLNT